MYMKKLLLSLCLMVYSSVGLAQERRIKLPEAPKQSSYTEFSLKEKGYWWSLDFTIGPSLTFNERNLLTTGINFVNGYRFDEYLRVGIGIGVQYHAANNNNIRETDIKWTMPIYLNARGNFMSQEVREIVPFWSIDVGGVIRDGFMFTPSVGARIGEQRSAFLFSLGYSFRTIDAIEKHAKARNYIVLKLGYEF